MSSMTRRIQRKSTLRDEGRPWFFKDLPDGGYMVLHPTRGWRRISGQRLRAQGGMAETRQRAVDRFLDKHRTGIYYTAAIGLPSPA